MYVLWNSKLAYCAETQNKKVKNKDKNAELSANFEPDEIMTNNIELKIERIEQNNATPIRSYDKCAEVGTLKTVHISSAL